MRRLVRPTGAAKALPALLACAAVGLIAAAPVSALPRTFEVRLPDGALTTVTVDAPPQTPMDEVQGLPGVPIREIDPVEADDDDAPSAREGHRNEQRRSHEHVDRARRGQPRPHKPRRHRHRRAGGPEAPAARPSLALLGPFRAPLFLLPVYQSAALRYGVRWELLAAINEVESDFGRNARDSTAGATGWMQFLPSTWTTYGVDGNGDGWRDPANPVDAIFAAARYLQAAGAGTDERAAVFAYNHAGWYVDSVLLRAERFAAYPVDAIGWLTALAQERFPVAAHARYDVRGGSSARVMAHRGAPVVATVNGVVRRIGVSSRRGRFVVLEDAFGSRFVYSHLGSLARYHPVPRRGGQRRATPVAAPRATAPGRLLGVQASTSAEPVPRVIRRRLFAHPARRHAQFAGGFDQILESQGGTVAAYGDAAGPPLRLDPRHAVLKPLRRGSRVLASTMLGRVARVRGGFGAMTFAVRGPGAHSPAVDPRPALDSWRLLAAAGYRPDPAAAVLGLPQGSLERRVLRDPRIAMYACGRRDVRAGRIDRRVLAMLEYLAESGLEPSVSSLECGHGLYTASGNVSEHSAGAAVDISAVNGVPVQGHQGPGDVAEQVVRRLMLLGGPLRPHQIISLRSFGANTLALADHYDHVHVGFYPQTLKRDAGSTPPGDLTDLFAGIADVTQPPVFTRPSGNALPR